jgi:hypothetical protein
MAISFAGLCDPAGVWSGSVTNRSRLPKRGTSGGRDAEHRVVGSDAEQLRVGCIGPDAFDEHFDFEGPLLQVGAEQRRLVGVPKLLGPEGLVAPSEP